MSIAGIYGGYLDDDDGNDGFPLSSPAKPKCSRSYVVFAEFDLEKRLPYFISKDLRVGDIISISRHIALNDWGDGFRYQVRLIGRLAGQPGDQHVEEFPNGGVELGVRDLPEELLAAFLVDDDGLFDKKWVAEYSEIPHFLLVSDASRLKALSDGVALEDMYPEARWARDFSGKVKQQLGDVFRAG